jgi:hypothetical protein
VKEQERRGAVRWATGQPARCKEVEVVNAKERLFLQGL